jgi:hypothetical protein
MRLEEGEFGSPGHHLPFTFCRHSPSLVLRSYDGAASLVAVSGPWQALLRVRHYTSIGILPRVPLDEVESVERVNC